MLDALRTLFGTASSREQARARLLARKVQRAGESLREADESELRQRAQALRERAREGASTDSLLVECYALVCEVSARRLGLRPFPTQVMGAVAMHRSHIVEMKTGEGKTLAASLPATLHALSGRGVHVVTVNDYLAKRDAAQLSPIYEFFGLTVGVVTEDVDADFDNTGRKSAYAADITYVTNHELVFDYLRDNLANSKDEMVLRPLNYALVDEVDFLLLDEARTPLIISGPSGDDTELCHEARRIAASLKPELHYLVDHRSRQVMPTEAGIRAMERAAGIRNLADEANAPWQHALYNAMLAHAVYERDVDYVRDDEEGKVLLVDEFTGRVSADKRFSDGLHQALEAKEDLPVRPEDRTLAKTSYQNYFRLYPRLAGMTGTAWSAREEFSRVYGLKVVRVPTHEPMIREDLPSQVYRSAEEKFAAVVARVESLQAEGRPVLIGSTSVRESERLGERLKAAGLPNQVLNAKNHEAEAAVIAQAGRSGMITVSTNMAGRGVDIKLGGCPEKADDEAHCREAGDEVRAAGGLAVIGTGLHEAKRIDDQLRGRAGRQGDPGSSEYFLSLDDPLYKKFGEILDGAPILNELRQRLKDHPAGRAVRDWNVLRTLEALRKKVEVENEAARKDVLKYDLVIEEQRQHIFTWRRKLLGFEGAPGQSAWQLLLEETPAALLQRHGIDDVLEPEALEDLSKEVQRRYELDLEELGDWRESGRAFQLQTALEQALDEKVHALVEELGEERMAELSSLILLETIDQHWTEHLSTLERVDEGIGLRSYAELDPALEFRKEAAALFKALLRDVRIEALAEVLALAAEDDDAPDLDIQFVWLNPAVQRQHRKNLKR